MMDKLKLLTDNGTDKTVKLAMHVCVYKMLHECILHAHILLTTCMHAKMQLVFETKFHQLPVCSLMQQIVIYAMVVGNCMCCISIDCTNYVNLGWFIYIGTVIQ